MQGFKKGQLKPAGSGRKKGTVNKIDAEVRTVIETVFNRLGGTEFLYEFAVKNPEMFLEKIWVKLLPLQVKASVDVTDFSLILEQARSRAIDSTATKVEDLSTKN